MQIRDYQVLVIDNDVTNLKVYVEFLSTLNCKVDYVENGPKAINKIINNNYDIVFTDIIMPEMDGIEFTKKIREYEKESNVQNSLPIIALTAYSKEDLHEKCLEVGVNEVIVKPASKKQLKEALEKWVCIGSNTTELADGLPEENIT